MSAVKFDVSFLLTGKPTGKQRHKTTSINNYIRHYTPKKTVSYERLVRQAFCAVKPHSWNLGGYFGIRIAYCFAVPSYWPKKKQQAALDGLILPDKKPDVDNALKIIMDGLNGEAWHDDKQVVSDDGQKKVYAKEDGVIVWIREILTADDFIF